MKSITFLFLAFFLAAMPSASGQDASYWQAQALSDHQNGSSNLALEDIEEYLALEPDDPWGWSFKANLLKDRNYGRWIEYFFSSSIMIVLISMITGVKRAPSGPSRRSQLLFQYGHHPGGPREL